MLKYFILSADVRSINKIIIYKTIKLNLFLIDLNNLLLCIIKLMKYL